MVKLHWWPCAFWPKACRGQLQLEKLDHRVHPQQYCFPVTRGLIRDYKNMWLIPLFCQIQLFRHHHSFVFFKKVPCLLGLENKEMWTCYEDGNKAARSHLYEQMKWPCVTHRHAKCLLNIHVTGCCDDTVTYARIKRLPWHTDDVLLLNGENIFGQVQSNIKRLLITFLHQINPSLCLRTVREREKVRER